MHREPEPGRPPELLQQVRRGGGRVHPQAVPRLRLRDLRRPRGRADALRGGPHHQRRQRPREQRLAQALRRPAGPQGWVQPVARQHGGRGQSGGVAPRGQERPGQYEGGGRWHGDGHGDG